MLSVEQSGELNPTEQLIYSSEVVRSWLSIERSFTLWLLCPGAAALLMYLGKRKTGRLAVLLGAFVAYCTLLALAVPHILVNPLFNPKEESSWLVNFMWLFTGVGIMSVVLWWLWEIFNILPYCLEHNRLRDQKLQHRILATRLEGVGGVPTDHVGFMYHLFAEERTAYLKTVAAKRKDRALAYLLWYWLWPLGAHCWYAGKYKRATIWPLFGAGLAAGLGWIFYGVKSYTAGLKVEATSMVIAAATVCLIGAIAWGLWAFDGYYLANYIDNHNHDLRIDTYRKLVAERSADRRRRK